MANFGERMRQAFIAPPGYVWVGADYSQLEVRTFSLVAHADRLIQAYKDAEFDIHQWVVDLSGGVLPRRTTKILTFGGFFGQQENSAYLTTYKAYKDAGEEPPTRQAFHQFFIEHRRQFPELPRYHRMIEEQIDRHGYVQTWFGRKLFVQTSKGHELRSAISMPIQGTAADIVKLAIPETLKVVVGYGGQLIGQVHDELPSYLPETLFAGYDQKEDTPKPQVYWDIKAAMEQCVSLPVPLKVDIKWGRNWYEAH